MAAETEAPVEHAGLDTKVVRVDRGVHSEGRRPVVAVGPRPAKARAVPAACGGKEDTVAVRAGGKSPSYACTIVIVCPCPGTIIQ